MKEMHIKMCDVNSTNGGSRFSKLLYSTVTRSEDAVHLLKRDHEDGGLSVEGGFCFYKARYTPDNCDCWFDLEYFDFIEGDMIDKEMLNTVCENLQRGQCAHLSEREQHGENVAECRSNLSTTLLHAAAASGNESVVKYLTDVHGQLRYTSSNTKVKPFHLAVIKTQSHVLKHLYENTATGTWKTRQEFFINEMRLVKRNPETKALSECVCHNLMNDYNTACLLNMYNVRDIATIGKLIEIAHQFGYIKGLLYSMLTYLLVNDSKQLVMLILSVNLLNKITLFDKKTNAQKLIVACVLADDTTVLQMMCANEVNLSFTEYGYNLLDIARIVGSKQCASILKQHMTKTRKIRKEISPYNFLLQMTFHFPANVKYHGLLTKCVEQGFDVNKKDKKFGKPPLHVAISEHRVDFVKALLEVGADVDAKHGVTVPVSLALQRAMHFGPQCQYDLLKSVLYYNPSPNSGQDILSTAAWHDVDKRHLEHVNSSDKIIFISEIPNRDINVVAESPEDRYLAMSAFALLYELGFPEKQSIEEFVQRKVLSQIQNRGEVVPHLKMFCDYVQKVTLNPRSLKSLCRMVVRQAHPGRRLHAYLSGTMCPKFIVNYILRPYILRRIQIVE